MCGCIAYTFPPDIAIIGFGNVSKDTVFGKAFHGIGIGVHAGSWRDTKKSGFRVNRVKLAIIAKFHPADIVAYCFNSPAGNSRNEHRQIGFATCAGERADNVMGLTFRISQFQNQHMFREPTFVPRHDRSDS